MRSRPSGSISASPRVRGSEDFVLLAFSRTTIPKLVFKASRGPCGVIAVNKIIQFPLVQKCGFSSDFFGKQAPGDGADRGPWPAKRPQLRLVLGPRAARRRSNGG